MRRGKLRETRRTRAQTPDQGADPAGTGKKRRSHKKTHTGLGAVADGAPAVPERRGTWKRESRRDFGLKTCTGSGKSTELAEKSGSGWKKSNME